VETAARLGEVRAKIDRALEAVRGDQRASPVLVAVVGEFAAKGEKAAAADDERGAVIELEQAGDSPKWRRRPTPISRTPPGRRCSTRTLRSASPSRSSEFDARLAV